jgi:hypothetical protein
MEHREDAGVAFRVTHAGQPVRDACLLLHLVMDLENDVPMVAGPTDETGSVFVSAAEMSRRIDDVAQMWSMEYRLDTWTHALVARVMTKGDVLTYTAAHQVWSELFPPGQPEAVRNWNTQRIAYPNEAWTVGANMIGDVIESVEIRVATLGPVFDEALRALGSNQDLWDDRGDACGLLLGEDEPIGYVGVPDAFRAFLSWGVDGVHEGLWFDSHDQKHAPNVVMVSPMDTDAIDLMARDVERWLDLLRLGYFDDHDDAWQEERRLATAEREALGLSSIPRHLGPP